MKNMMLLTILLGGATVALAVKPEPSKEDLRPIIVIPLSGEKTFLRFCFAAAGRRHYPDQPLDEGIRQALWLSRAELSARASQLRSPMVLRCVDDYLAGRRYPLALLERL